MRVLQGPYRTAAQIDEDRILQLVHAPRATLTLARIFAAFVAVLVVAFVFAPWQQNTQSQGRVIAYAPVERQQTVDAPVEGRVVHWHVQEGDHVEEGSPIADLADNDPNILTRLGEERAAQVARIDAARARMAAVDARVVALGGSAGAAAKAADARVKMASDRVLAAEAAAQAAAQAAYTAQINVDRQRQLHGEGLASKRTVELAELDDVKAKTEADRAQAGLRAARSEHAAVAADATRVGTDAQAAINDATATRALADAEIASATAELARIDVRLARQSMQSVKAPRAGTILRVVAKQGGEILKAGSTLAVIVPDTHDRAVELWVGGNDVPLVTPGRRVRLQFEGWPAVQFAGWPQDANGTIGGTVAFVDAADDGTGRFRVVVVPDGNEPWPATRFLRQGTRANGWVLLDRVRLGFEVWRQLNGFPPQLPTKEMFEEKKK